MNRKSISTLTGLILTALAIVILSAQITAAQDFTVQMKDETGKLVATHYISRNAVRNVSNYMADTDMIYRLDKGTIITVNNKAKTFSEVTLAEVRQMAARKESAMSPQQKEMMHRMGFGSAASVTKVGAGEAIAGYATEKYVVKGATYQSELWVAPALDVPAGYYDMVSAFIGSSSGGVGLMIKELKEKQIKGYLVKSVGTVSFSPMTKGITVTQVASSIEKRPIPASIFEAPSGYQKVMPSN